MFQKFFDKIPKKQIGLEITPEGVFICVVNNMQKKTFLEKFLFKKFDEPVFQNGSIANQQILSETIKELLKDQGLGDKPVNLCVPGNMAFVKTITFPNLPDAELSLIIPQEAGKHIPTPVNEVNVDFEIVRGSKNEKVTVILAALPKYIASAYVDSVTMAGLKPASIDISSFAMIRTLAHTKQIDDSDNANLCVLIGNESTDISVIHKGMPLFTHNILIGKKNMVETISSGMELSSGESERLLSETVLVTGGSPAINDPQILKASSLVKNIFNNISGEVQKTMEFFLTQNPKFTEISKIFIGGWGVCPQNVDKYFNSRLKTEVEFCNTLANIDYTALEGEDFLNLVNQPKLSTLVGLAIKE